MVNTGPGLRYLLILWRQWGSTTCTTRDIMYYNGVLFCCWSRMVRLFFLAATALIVFGGGVGGEGGGGGMVVVVYGQDEVVYSDFCGCDFLMNTAGGMRELYREDNCVFRSDCTDTELTLRGNVASIAPGTFDGLVSLTTLDLGFNRLTSIAPGTFDGL
eukprot:1355853-Pyramimonas_sp.AAC.1